MAEQSLGWATTGTGDGVSGGYNEARMASMQTGTFGTGVFFTGNRFQRTWTTTSITVDTGACMIGGYFYENTSAATINFTTGAAGTYYLVVYLNGNTTTTACVANVTANNPSSTTIAGKTVRLAIVTSTAYASPPAGTTLIGLHTITWSGAAITAVSDIRPFITPVTPNLPVLRLYKSAGQTIATGTTGADITTYATKYQSPDGLITADASTGVISINAPGVYLVDFAVHWAASTLGNRHLRLCSASENTVEVCATSMAAATFITNAGGSLTPATGYVQRATTTFIREQINTTSTPTYETIFLRVAQDSGTSLSVSRAQITVTRISDIPPIV